MEGFYPFIKDTICLHKYLGDYSAFRKHSIRIQTNKMSERDSVKLNS